MNKPGALHIIDAVGEGALKSSLAMSDRNLRHIRAQGVFPSRYYGPLKDLCEAKGIHCPLSAFVWFNAGKKVVNASSPAADASRDQVVRKSKVAVRSENGAQS